MAFLSLAMVINTAQAQWDIQESQTTASLRGIHNVGGGVAWASGTSGTVLRTEDGGYLWQTCNIPPGAEKLDFRGIQAFDENTAIVMSSGPGDQSRLYKTTDRCQTWKLLFINPDKEGFWDTIVMHDQNHGWLLGDAVNDRFVIEETSEGAARFPGLQRTPTAHLASEEIPANGRGAFAASNSSLTFIPLGTRPKNHCRYSDAWIGTSGPGGAMAYRLQYDQPQCSDWGNRAWIGESVPIAGHNSSSGIFSLAFRDEVAGIAVGGNYLKPDDPDGTAACTIDGGRQWTAAQTPPHGYRSAVAYDAQQKLWITVGPNGTDISRDDGKNWTPLKPSPTDPPDADKDWNALSLPFVVGPKGRIAKLRTDALRP
jgi:photosystem II stability/assembly factor-like uncharacterized protein